MNRLQDRVTPRTIFFTALLLWMVVASIWCYLVTAPDANDVRLKGVTALLVLSFATGLALCARNYWQTGSSVWMLLVMLSSTTIAGLELGDVAGTALLITFSLMATALGALCWVLGSICRSAAEP